MKLFIPFLSIIMVACSHSPSQQELAYQKAFDAEQRFSTLHTQIIIEYKKVIMMDTKTKWAKLAQERVDALEAKRDAQDLRRSIQLQNY